MEIICYKCGKKYSILGHPKKEKKLFCLHCLKNNKNIDKCFEYEKRIFVDKKNYSLREQGWMNEKERAYTLWKKNYQYYCKMFDTHLSLLKKNKIDMNDKPGIDLFYSEFDKHLDVIPTTVEATKYFENYIKELQKTR